MQVLRLSPILLALFILACSDSEAPPAPPSTSENDATIVPVSPAEKPASVPGAAEAIDETQVLGQIVREPGATPQGVRTRRIEELSCQQGVMLLMTDEETIYAAIQCDGVPSGEQLDLFLGQEAAIELEAGESRFRVLIETLSGSQAEFTVAGIWVE